MLCSYGCNQEGLFSFKNGKSCCHSNQARCPAIRKKIIDNHPGSCYDSLSEETKNNMAWNRGKHFGTQFTLNGTGNHKAVLIQERGHKCETCQNEEWQGSPIPLELEHIDGNNRNNVKPNLKLLCCNCHALTPTWRGRNINSGITKVSDQELLTALKECSNIRQALQSVGLAAKGGNYTRAQKLLKNIAPMA